MLAKLSRLTLAPWNVKTALGSSRESIMTGWLYRLSVAVIGLIESPSCRLPRVLKLVMIRGGYWMSLSAVFPSRPALLMVLVFRVIPDGLAASPCSCSRCCFLLRQRAKNTTPTIAKSPTTPPTTPPAMAPVFFLPPSLSFSAEEDVGMATTVRVTTAPLSVTTQMLVEGCWSPSPVAVVVGTVLRVVDGSEV